MESLRDNWLKNNHITIDIMYYLHSLLVSVFFSRVLGSKLVQDLNSVNPRRGKETLVLKELNTAFYKFRWSNSSHAFAS